METSRAVRLCIRVVILTVIFVQVLSHHGCDLPTCDQGSNERRNSHELWYNEQPGFVHSHIFRIEQTSSIQTTNWPIVNEPPTSLRDVHGEVMEDDNQNEGSHDDRAHRDSQTATITGSIDLVRGTGAMSCTASFIVTNSTIMFKDPNRNDTTSRPLILEGPTIFPFIFFSSDPEEQDIRKELHNICVPQGEDVWKTNLRRSLVFMLASNVNLYQDLKTKGPKDFHRISEEEAQLMNETDLFGPSEEGVTNYGMYISDNETSPTGLMKLRVSPHTANPHQLTALRTLSKEIDLHYKNSTVVEELRTKAPVDVVDGFYSDWMKILDPFSNFGLTLCYQTFRNGMVDTAHCGELQRVATQSYLAVDVTTMAEIKAIKKDSPIPANTAQWKSDGVPMNKVSMKYDSFSTILNSDAAIVQDFSRLLSELCENVDSPKSLLDFRERIRTIMPLISTKVLKEQFAILKEKHCGTTSAFLNLVSSTPSDDSVEFMVDLITKRDDAVNEEIFANFLWTATLMPTTERDDFQRYAGPQSIEALQKLLDGKEFYHRKYGMSDSEFLLHMVGLLDKERKSEEIEDIVPGAMYVLEIAAFISAVENNGTDDSIDRATHLQIIRALEKYSQQIDPNSDDDDDDISDPYERLIVSHPCSKKHATFLAQILEDEKFEEDLKIMAYLFMRKCYIPEWREMVKGYVKSKKANEEVVHFIVQHVEAISEGYNSLQYADDEEEVASAVESTTGNGTSELGYTIFSTSDTDIKLYGHREVKKAQIGLEINVVKGRSFIPRLVRMQVQTFGNDGEQTNVELELLRLESGKSKEPELLVTFSENSVAMYTTTITLDQSKLLQLLQDGSESAFVDFLASFSIMNRPFLTKFLQNRKLEVFKRVLFHEYRRNFPSLSGLPIKSRVNLDWIFSHNFTNHYEQGIDGEKLYSLRLNPAISCQMLEQISVGFGHDEILGYQLSSGINLNYNLELVLSRSKDGVYKAKIGFGRDKSKAKYFEFVSINILKLERYQILLDSSDVKKSSGHIWKSKHGPSVDQVELETYSDLLKDRICRAEHELQGLFASGPLFLSGSYLCDIPSAIIFELSPTFDNQQVSLGLKVYPEGGYSHHDEIPHYLWRIGIRRNQTENFRLYDFHVQLVDPSKHHELNVTLRLQGEIPMEQVLTVNYSGSKGSYGFEIYKKFSGYSQYHQSPRGENQRRRRSTAAGLGKLTFGITAWSPIPGYEKVNVIVGEMSHVPEKSIHVFIETEGIHPSLNSELQYTMSKDNAATVNLPMSIDGEDYTIPTADRIKLTFEMENDELGKFTLKNNVLKFRSPVPKQTRDRLNGTFEITYGRREWNTISGDYNAYIKTFPTTEDEQDGWVVSMDLKEKVVSKDMGVQCDIRFSQFATLDFTLESKCHEINRYEFNVNLTNDTDCMNGTHRANCHSEVWFKHSPKNVVQKVTWELDKTFDEVEKDDEGCRLWKIITKLDVDLPGFTLVRYYTKENNFKKSISLLEIGFQFGLIFESSSLWSRVFYKIDEVTRDFHPRPQIVFEVSAREADGANYMLLLEQKLVVISDLLIDYNGTLSLPRMGLNYKLDGTLEPAYAGSWFIYKGFNIGIKTDQEGIKPYSFSLKEISDEDSAKHYKLLLTGQHPIFDSSVKFLKAKSPEGYLMSVKSSVPGFYNIKADMGSGIAHFVLHIDGEELKVQGKIGWPGDATQDTLFIVKLDATNVETGQSVLSFNSLSELKHINSSNSIYLRDFQIINFPDILVISKSDLLISYPIGAPPINKTLDVSFQLLPHEEPQRPIISTSLVDGISGDKYSAQISSQVKCLETSCDMPNLVVGQWLVLERPSVTPYTFSWTMTPSYKENSQRPLSARNRVLFNDSLTLQIEVQMSHHGFFCPEFDTEIDSRFVGTRKGRYWAEYNGDKENPSMREVLFLNTTASVSFDFLVKAAGVQSLAERNLHGEVTRIEYENKADSLWGGYFRTAGGRRDDLKLHYNVTLQENNSRHRFTDTTNSSNPAQASTRIEGFLRDALNSRMFKDRFTEIGWSWISGIDGEDSDEDIKDVSEGTHRVNVFFDSWRNFELQAGHTIKSILGDYSWTDKLYSVYPAEDGLSEGTCGIQSSKLFSGSAKTKLGGVETMVEILYPMLRTRLTSTYETPAPEAGDPFIHIKYKLKCSSVLLNEDILLDFNSGTAHSSAGVEYKTYLVYNTPWIIKTNFTSHIKRQKGQYADLHGEFVTHTATSIQDPSRYGSRMEWKSISLILYENQRQSDPIFLHYDYDTQVSRYYATNAKYSPSYKSSGSFSSTPGPAQQLLQLRLDKKRSWNPDDCIIEINEAMIRLGRLVDAKEIKCQELESYLSTLLDNEKSYDMENIIKFYKSKLACGRCRPNGDCKESVGHFLLNSIQTNESVDALSLKSGQLPASIQQNNLIQAVWSEEGSCSSERADFNLYRTNSLENGDKICAMALKDLGGCWAGLKAAKCNKSAKSKGAKLWKDIVANMNPTAISGTADGIISYLVWFFHM